MKKIQKIENHIYNYLFAPSSVLIPTSD